MTKPRSTTPPPANPSGSDAAPGSTAGAQPNDPPAYRSNPEVDARIDAHIKANPKFWAYVQQMPRERLERSVVLNEVRELERRERMREGTLKRIAADPSLKQAYDRLVKDLPEDQREAVIARLARQTHRTVERVKGEQTNTPPSVRV